MATLEPSIGTPVRETLPSTALDARRVLLPDRTTHVSWYSTAEGYVEYRDVADGTARSSAYETLIAGARQEIEFSGRVIMLSGSQSSQVVELTPLSRTGQR